MSETNRASLIEMMLRVPLRGLVDSGTVDGTSSTSTVVCDTLERPDDFYQNMTPVAKVRIVSTTDGAAPKSEERRISDFVNSTGTITISTDKLFSAAPAVGDTFVILSEYEWSELAAALNLVIDSLPESALVPKIDGTMTAQADTQEYTLPDGFRVIYRITQENDSGDYVTPIPPDQYTILDTNPPKLKLYQFPTELDAEGFYYGSLWYNSRLSDGKHFRIEGFTKQERLETDDDICYLNPLYIVFKAAALVLASRVTAADYDSYKTRAQELERQAETYYDDLIDTMLPPDAKWCGAR